MKETPQRTRRDWNNRHMTSMNYCLAKYACLCINGNGTNAITFWWLQIPSTTVHSYTWTASLYETIVAIWHAWATTELTNIKMCKIKGYAAYSISLPTEVWLATYTTIEVFIDWSSTTNQRFLNKILATNRNVAGPYYSRPLTRTVRLFLPNGS